MKGNESIVISPGQDIARVGLLGLIFSADARDKRFGNNGSYSGKGAKQKSALKGNASNGKWGCCAAKRGWASNTGHDWKRRATRRAAQADECFQSIGHSEQYFGANVKVTEQINLGAVNWVL